MWKKPEIEESQPRTEPQPVVLEPGKLVSQSTKEQVMIGKTLHIKGDLIGEEDLLIEGYIDGKIQLPQHNVTVGKNARVNADIYGNVIVIEGDVEGNLFGEDRLILKESSKVRGNIIAPRVILEDGSNFKGSIDMNPKEVGNEPADTPIPSSERRSNRETVNTGNTAPAANIADM